MTSLQKILQTSKTLEELFDYAHAPLNSPTLSSRHFEQRYHQLLDMANALDEPERDALTQRIQELYEQFNYAYELDLLTPQGILIAQEARFKQGDIIHLMDTALEILETRTHSTQVITARVSTPLKNAPVATLTLAQQRDQHKHISRAASALRTLFDSDAPQHKHLPRLIQSGAIKEDTQILALLTYTPESTVLTEAITHYQDLQQPQHVIWVLRRALSAIGWAHACGIVHANLCPDTLFIDPSTHNLWINGWENACINPAQTGHQFIHHHPDFSPPEVMQRRPPLPSSDLYSLGQTMKWLLNNGQVTDTLPDVVPDELQKLLKFMTLPNPLGRARDAWKLYHEVERIRRELYGQHTFTQLLPTTH